MFKFNFDSNEDVKDDCEGKPESNKELALPEPRPTKQMHFEDCHKEYASLPGEHVELPNGDIIHHVDLGIAEWRVKDKSDIQKAVSGESDLLPNKYEGGLKIWECSIDLTEYISSLNIAFRGLKVLEVGCGVGIPGMYAYNQGAEVHFQDYNDEVINVVTIPSVFLNASELEDDISQNLPSCKFFAGDWSGLTELIRKLGENEKTEMRYDVIFMSETIYSIDHYQTLHRMMDELLQPSGTIYLAAKTFYFGVGGGTRQFEEVLTKEGVFDFKVVKEIVEGVRREILEIRRKPTS